MEYRQQPAQDHHDVSNQIDLLMAAYETITARDAVKGTLTLAILIPVEAAKMRRYSLANASHSILSRAPNMGTSSSLSNGDSSSVAAMTKAISTFSTSCR